MPAEQKAKSDWDDKRKLAMMLGIDPDKIDYRPKAPDPKSDECRNQADAMAREERKRLIRELKKRQHTR